jgi:AraC-like DNA-binding protein
MGSECGSRNNPKARRNCLLPSGNAGFFEAFRDILSYMASTQSGGGLALFRYIPDTGYFAKDRHGRFVAANAAFVRMAGLREESDLLDKTDYDIWPRFLAEHYVKDDSRVLDSAEPVVNRVELVLGRDRSADWFTTTKVPLRDSAGAVAGLEGVCRHLKKANSPPESTQLLPGVVDYIMENYSGKIEIPALARMALLSVKQFERNFKKEYGEPPLRYIQRIRLEAARQLLAVTRHPIGRIARETGFYDTSHFSRQFQKHSGHSPRAFRALQPVPAR